MAIVIEKSAVISALICFSQFGMDQILITIFRGTCRCKNFSGGQRRGDEAAADAPFQFRDGTIAGGSLSKNLPFSGQVLSSRLQHNQIVRPAIFKALLGNLKGFY